jgi:uncharacterized protein YndB with AHSA1/START domain
MVRSNAASNQTDHDVLLTRDIEAPRELVFEAWTNPKHLGEWWGPEGFTNRRCELELRPAGAIRIDLVGPDGTVYPMGGFYQEIVEPERLVFSSSVLDGLDHSLIDVINTVTFAPRGSKTRVTIEAHILRATEESAPYIEGMETGWKQCLERLSAYVTKISRNAQAR